MTSVSRESVSTWYSQFLPTAADSGGAEAGDVLGLAGVLLAGAVDGDLGQPDLSSATPVEPVSGVRALQFY